MLFTLFAIYICVEMITWFTHRDVSSYNQLALRVGLIYNWQASLVSQSAEQGSLLYSGCLFASQQINSLSFCSSHKTFCGSSFPPVQLLALQNAYPYCVVCSYNTDVVLRTSAKHSNCISSMKWRIATLFYQKNDCDAAVFNSFDDCFHVIK